MPGADRFRDSTQIRLSAEALDGVRDELETRFTLTVRQDDGQVRIIGSPVEIKEATSFLAKNGVNLA